MDQMELLSRLFYDFRVAQLNSKYYSRRFSRLKSIDRGLSILVMVATAASFGVLAFDDAIPHSKQIAAGLSVLAFLIAVAIPIFSLGDKAESLADRTRAFHYAAQQLEGAIRFTKAAQNGTAEAMGWFQCAEDAYKQAAALPDLDGEDHRLIKKVEDEINAAFPVNYVWTSL